MFFYHKKKKKKLSKGRVDTNSGKLNVSGKLSPTQASLDIFLYVRLVFICICIDHVSQFYKVKLRVIKAVITELPKNLEA